MTSQCFPEQFLLSCSGGAINTKRVFALEDISAWLIWLWQLNFPIKLLIHHQVAVMNNMNMLNNWSVLWKRRLTQHTCWSLKINHSVCLVLWHKSEAFRSQWHFCFIIITTLCCCWSGASRFALFHSLDKTREQVFDKSMIRFNLITYEHGVTHHPQEDGQTDTVDLKHSRYRHLFHFLSQDLICPCWMHYFLTATINYLYL